MSLHTPIVVNRAVTLITMECWNCAVMYAIPERMYAKRREDGGEFWCPNGHGAVFGESDTKRLEKETVRLAGLVRVEQARSRQLENDLLDKAKEAKRLARRAKAGVCPQCHRAFQALARHMETQH